MEKNDFQLKKQVFLTEPDPVLKEISAILSRFPEKPPVDAFFKAFADIRNLFEGRFPGFRASNTQYHDFEHTLSVVLATTRLMHGCILNGHYFSPQNILLALLAALFHDVGLIQSDEDQQGSGAKYTIGHEERSIIFMQNYLSGGHYSAREIETCANIIRCTILSFAPALIPFQSNELRQLGNIVGSSDLLGQMGDRLYLEKLLLLYKEFEEAHIPGFGSELEILKKTTDFYEIVAKKRLYNDLEGICRHMHSHFKATMGLDRDFYAESIQGNIAYLESVVHICNDSLDCYLENLRRGGISHEVRQTLSLDRTGSDQ